MTKRRLLRWSLILVILAAFAVGLEPTRVVWGWLRGDVFFQGRPTRWWRAELVNVHVQEIWENMPITSEKGWSEPRIVVRRFLEYREPKGWLPWFATKVLRMKTPDTSALWAPFLRDDGADDVLAALNADVDPEIRKKAEVIAHDRRLTWIEQFGRGVSNHSESASKEPAP